MFVTQKVHVTGAMVLVTAVLCTIVSRVTASHLVGHLIPENADSCNL
jgi:hypothetical protein